MNGHLLTYPECNKTHKAIILDVLTKVKGERITSMGLKKILPFQIKESTLKRILNEMESSGHILSLGAKFNASGRAYQVIKNGYE